MRDTKKRHDDNAQPNEIFHVYSFWTSFNEKFSFFLSLIDHQELEVQRHQAIRQNIECKELSIISLNLSQVHAIEIKILSSS